MARWYGAIGFAEFVETVPGVHAEQIVEHKYYGQVLQNVWQNQTSGQVNDTVDVSNRISIISDHYAEMNSQHIRYVEFMGTRWKVTSISAEYPRLIMSMGGVYNG